MDIHQAEIFQLYVVQKKKLNEVMEYMRIVHGVKPSRNMYNKNLKKWGYGKNLKRADVLQILRERNELDGTSNELTLAQRRRPIDIEKLQRYCNREKLRNTDITESHISQPNGISGAGPSLSMPKALPVFRAWRTPEKFLYDINCLVKGSFESGEWCHDGPELIIRSSPCQDKEKKSLHAFIGEVDKGCAAALSGNMELAGKNWLEAFTHIEILVDGHYHDNLPNMIWKINDLKYRGCVDVALLLKEQMTAWSARHQSADQSRASIFQGLGQIDLDMLTEIEERMMACFVSLFDFYLGGLSYNSFVMVMNAARRKLARDPWSTFEDWLPSLSQKESEFGPTNRRPLDIIRLRTEILHERGIHEEAEAQAALLVQRAELIENDEWQRLYFLIKGLYYMSVSQHLLQKEAATGNMERALDCEQEFAEIDENDIFKPEKVILKAYLGVE